MIVSLAKAGIWGNFTQARQLNIVEALDYLSYEKEFADLRELAQREAEQKAKMKKRK